MPDPALQGLYAVRLAPYAWADVLAALVMGLCFALLIGGVLSIFRARRVSAIDQDIAAARRLPAEARAIVLARVLKEATERNAPGAAPWPDRAAQHFGLDTETTQALMDLYTPGAALPPEPLERALSAARTD